MDGFPQIVIVSVKLLAIVKVSNLSFLMSRIDTSLKRYNFIQVEHDS